MLISLKPRGCAIIVVVDDLSLSTCRFHVPVAQSLSTNSPDIQPAPTFHHTRRERLPHTGGAHRRAPPVFTGGECLHCGSIVGSGSPITNIFRFSPTTWKSYEDIVIHSLDFSPPFFKSPWNMGIAFGSARIWMPVSLAFQISLFSYRVLSVGEWFI